MKRRLPAVPLTFWIGLASVGAGLLALVGVFEFFAMMADMA